MNEITVNGTKYYIEKCKERKDAVCICAKNDKGKYKAMWTTGCVYSLEISFRKFIDEVEKAVLDE